MANTYQQRASTWRRPAGRSVGAVVVGGGERGLGVRAANNLQQRASPSRRPAGRSVGGVVVDGGKRERVVRAPTKLPAAAPDENSAADDRGALRVGAATRKALGQASSRPRLCERNADKVSSAGGIWHHSAVTSTCRRSTHRWQGAAAPGRMGGGVGRGASRRG